MVLFVPYAEAEPMLKEDPVKPQAKLALARLEGVEGTFQLLYEE